MRLTDVLRFLFQLAFEATVGVSYSSDIAIDDVSMYDCGAPGTCGVNLLVKLFSKNSALHKKIQEA